MLDDAIGIVLFKLMFFVMLIFSKSTLLGNWLYVA